MKQMKANFTHSLADIIADIIVERTT